MIKLKILRLSRRALNAITAFLKEGDRAKFDYRKGSRKCDGKRL